AIDRLRPIPDARTLIFGPQNVLACVVRAMAYLRLDRRDEAHRQLAAAAAFMKQVPFDPEREGPLFNQWNDWLRYPVLCREADGLIRDMASRPATSPGDAAAEPRKPAGR